MRGWIARRKQAARRIQTAVGEIDDIIAQLRAAPERARELLPEMAAEVQLVLAENIAAERGPDGTPWPATKDGRHALKNAAGDLTSQVVGTAILVTLQAPSSLHHLGIARGGVRRPILPSKGIPAPVAEALGRVVKRGLGRPRP